MFHIALWVHGEVSDALRLADVNGPRLLERGNERPEFWGYVQCTRHESTAIYSMKSCFALGLALSRTVFLAGVKGNNDGSETVKVKINSYSNMFATVRVNNVGTS